MNSFRYVGIDSLDEVCSHVFHADQTESEVKNLMKADPEAFHYMIMGNNYEYLNYIEYYVSPYMVDILTVEINSALEDRALEAEHVEAKKVNFCYDQVAKLGVEIVHPQRPEIELVKDEILPEPEPTGICPDCQVDVFDCTIRCPACWFKFSDNPYKRKNAIEICTGDGSTDCDDCPFDGEDNFAACNDVLDEVLGGPEDTFKEEEAEPKCSDFERCEVCPGETTDADDGPKCRDMVDRDYN